MLQICYIPAKKAVPSSVQSYFDSSKLRHTMEKACNEINHLPAKKRKLVTTLFSVAATNILLADNLWAATASANLNIEQTFSPLVTLGEQFIDLVQFVGFYLAIGMCLFEIIKAFLESDPKRIPSILTKYAIAVASLYTVPLLFTAIKKAFSQTRAALQ